MSKKAIFFLVCILLLGGALRFFHLGQESLWVDEALTVHHALSKNYTEFIDLISATEAAPPGHYLFLHYWMQWFGSSEFSVRFPSAVFSTISILLFFFLLRKWCGENIALLGSLFFATSMLQVQFAQEARLYSLFTFLVLLAALFFIDIVQNDIKIYQTLFYFLILAFALYVNYLAIFLYAISLFLFFMIKKEKKEKFIWSIGHLLTAVCILLVLWPLPKIQFFILNNGLSEILISKHLPQIFASLGLFFYLLPPFIFGILLVALLICRKSLFRICTHRFFDTFFILLVATAGSLFLYSSFFSVSLGNIPLTRFPITNSYFLIRHSFFLVPLWYVFLSWKIFSLRWKKVIPVLTLTILLISGIASYEYYSTPTKPEWREAASFIQQQGENPLILLDKGGMSSEFLLRYYFKGEFKLLKLTFSNQLHSLIQIEERELLKELGNENHFWLILTRNPKTGDYYQKFLDQHFERDISKEFYQIKVYHYHQK